MWSLSVGFPCLGLEEFVERYPPGEVVDDADESGEHALGDQLQEVGVGEPGVVRLADHVVGDLAETMTLILPDEEHESELSLTHWMEERLLPLRGADERTQRVAMRKAWQELSPAQRLVLHKLITGEFRVGVSQRLVVRGLASTTGLAPEVISHRLMGDWTPSADFYRRLIAADTLDTQLSQPYPFFLANPLESDPSALGDISQWQIEWKWDGIRAQLIRRQKQIFLWSRGEDLMTERFPEIEDAALSLPDGTVLDGEILAWHDDHALPFAVLQTRIGRKHLTRRILATAPVVYLAFDILERDHQDIRSQPLGSRRLRLDEIIAALASGSRIRSSPLIMVSSWHQLSEMRASSRKHHAEGVMLKRIASNYGVGRPRGDWWKWKIEPYTVDAVLVYAQRGSGKRASLYTDYTFAVWDHDALVPFAKAYSGLTDEEIQEVDAFVRRNTLERFGPVRRVEPQLVFELAFENIQRSKRHRCGIAVRFPRIARWRRDKTPEQADTLQAIRSMLPDGGEERRLFPE
jgi:DNA ligase-1